MDLSKYYEEICKVPFLSREEEYRLVTLYKDPTTPEKEKKKAKDLLISSNLRFVFKAAKKASKGDPTEFAELISAGNEGLLVGLEKYELDKGVRLLSYAGWWIWQRILKEMSNMRLVTLPVWKQQISAKIQKMKEQNPAVTLEELRLVFPTVSDKDLKELSETRFLTYYIDDFDPEMFEINPIEDHVQENIASQQIADIINTLPPVHAQVILMAYGFNQSKPSSSKEIMQKLGLNRKEYQQIKSEALELLRDDLTEEDF